MHCCEICLHSCKDLRYTCLCTELCHHGSPHVASVDSGVDQQSLLLSYMILDKLLALVTSSSIFF